MKESKLVLIKTILKSKIFYVPVIVFAVVISAILIFLFNIDDTIIFPFKNKFHNNFFDDKASGGSSKITSMELNDSLLSFDFVLNKSIQSPYVGITIRSIDDSIIRLKYYNNVVLNLRGINIDRIDFSIVNPNPYKNEINNLKQTVFKATISITSAFNDYHIGIDQFKIPDWWNELMKVEDNPLLKPDLENIYGFNLSNLLLMR